MQGRIASTTTSFQHRYGGFRWMRYGALSLLSLVLVSSVTALSSPWIQWEIIHIVPFVLRTGWEIYFANALMLVTITVLGHLIDFSPIRGIFHSFSLVEHDHRMMRTRLRYTEFEAVISNLTKDSIESELHNYITS